MFQHKKYILPVLVLVCSMLLPAMASATSLNQAGIRLGRLAPSASAGNDVLVTFKLKTTATSVSKILVTFPSGFTLTTGTPATGTTFPSTPASITAPPGLPATATVTGAGAGLGGTILISGLTSASLNNTTLYGFTVPTGSVQNPSSGGAQYNPTVASQTSGGSTIDTTTTPVYITGASPADQVTVTASVAANFSFSLSATSDTVPQVDTTALQTSAGVTMTVSTNSILGYTAYVKSGSATGLTSATSGGNIPHGVFDGTPDTLTAGTTSEYTFVPSSGTLCVTSCGGSVAYDGEYNGITSGTGGSFNSNNFASFVSRSGYTGGDNIILKERISVNSAVRAATDYTDTLTVVAAGNY